MKRLVAILLLLALAQTTFSSAWAAASCDDGSGQCASLLGPQDPDAPASADVDHCGHLSSHLLAHAVEETRVVLPALSALRPTPPLRLTSRDTVPLTPPPLA